MGGDGWRSICRDNGGFTGTRLAPNSRVVYSEHVQLFTCQSHDSEVVSKNKVKVAGYHFERKKNKKKRKTKKKRKEHGRRVSRLAAGHSLFCHDHALNLSEPWTSPKARVKITHLQNWTAESVGSRAAWQPLFMSFHHSDAESDMEGSKGPSFLLQTPSLIVEAIHSHGHLPRAPSHL